MGGTSEFVLISNDVRMIEFFHDVDLLVDVLLKEGFFFYVLLADDLDRVRYFGWFCLR